MSWNYRVIEHKNHPVNPDPYYMIHSCYYDKDGNPNGLSMEPVKIGGETIIEIMEEIEKFKVALTKPILNFETLKPIE